MKFFEAVTPLPPPHPPPTPHTRTHTHTPSTAYGANLRWGFWFQLPSIANVLPVWTQRNLNLHAGGTESSTAYA